MAFWNRKKKKDVKAGVGRQPAKQPGKKRKFLPAEVKLLSVQAREAGLTSREISEVLGTGVATIDKWMRSYRDGGPAALIRRGTNPGARKICTALRERIEEHRREHPERGVRRIQQDLRREHGLEVGAETVRRVVNDAGLGNPAPASSRRPPQVRRFERELPNAMWQIDIFTFELKRMYRVYLVGMIDDHSRYIVGHGLFRQQKSEAVMEVVKGAIGQWGAPREILSDNGRQFASWRGKTEFQKTLTRQGIQHVRSAPHHPMTLGKIERFWRTIWEEFLEDAVFASFADARQRLDHWIAYYNHQRPHQGIGGACPADRFYGVAGDVEEALKHGCQENSLRLALGQETRPPLYLLGKLGETDVRVTRNGGDLEVRLGDEVHELIRLGTPYEADDEGLRRGETSDDDAVEGDDRRRALPGGGAGAERADADQGDLQDVWGDATDAEPGDRGGRGGGAGGTGEAQARPQGEERGGETDYRALEAAILLGEGGRALEDAVRGDEEIR
jgi:transposase InsO family protein